MYISAPSVFWSHLTYSSSHLLVPLPPQENVMPAQDFISHQINRFEWSNLPQPIYLHFSKGSYHLFLSLMLASQEQIRFSLEHATDCSWETKTEIPGRLWQTVLHCGNVKMNTASHLSCDLHKDTAWDGSKKKIFAIFTAVSCISWAVSSGVSQSLFVLWSQINFVTYTPSLLSARYRQVPSASETNFQPKEDGEGGREGKINLILGTSCTWRNFMIWEQTTKLMTRKLLPGSCSEFVWWRKTRQLLTLGKYSLI